MASAVATSRSTRPGSTSTFSFSAADTSGDQPDGASHRLFTDWPAAGLTAVVAWWRRRAAPAQRWVLLGVPLSPTRTGSWSDDRYGSSA